MDDPGQLQRSIAIIIERLELLNGVRDRALSASRQITRMSANAIRAAHRGQFNEAEAMLEDARQMLSNLNNHLAGYPSIFWAGYVQDALKEYSEGNLTLAALQGRELPTPAELGVEDAPYLNGLAEAASELRRDTLDALRRGEMERAGQLIGLMDEIYGQLVTVDFPDALTGGLRRTTDSLRAVLERTRGDVTVTQGQERLRATLSAVLELSGVHPVAAKAEMDQDEESPPGSNISTGEPTA